MRVIITGGTGLIGRHLAHHLGRDGYDVIVLSRNPEQKMQQPPSGVRVVGWDGKTPDGWGHLLDHPDTAVVNLAGQNPANWRWTPAHKRRVLQSRLDASQAVVQAVENAASMPSVIMQASAVGYYGHAGDERITEHSPPGDSWRAGVCVQWESAASHLNVRTVYLRIGIVLDQNGGALPSFLAAANLMGSQLGHGQQWVPWVHQADVAGAVRFLMNDRSASGPYNIVAPEPLRNHDFMQMVAHVRGRPAWVPLPEFVLRLAMGEQANVILDSQRVLPERLLNAGYRFHFPDAESALRDIMRHAHHWKRHA